MNNKASTSVATTAQRDWLLHMKATVDHLHNQWYGHDGFETIHSGLDQSLLQDTDRKIRLACKRLGIAVVEAHDPDRWDGEEFGPIVTTLGRSPERSVGTLGCWNTGSGDGAQWQAPNGSLLALSVRSQKHPKHLVALSRTHKCSVIISLDGKIICVPRLIFTCFAR